MLQRILAYYLLIIIQGFREIKTKQKKTKSRFRLAPSPSLTYQKPSYDINVAGKRNGDVLRLGLGG